MKMFGWCNQIKYCELGYSVIAGFICQGYVHCKNTGNLIISPIYKFKQSKMISLITMTCIHDAFSCSILVYVKLNVIWWHEFTGWFDVNFIVLPGSPLMPGSPAKLSPVSPFSPGAPLGPDWTANKCQGYFTYTNIWDLFTHKYTPLLF